MMILRPVSPTSPRGPSITKRPDGLRWKMVFLSRYFFGIIGLMARSLRSTAILSLVTVSLCWVEMKTVCTKDHAHPGRIHSQALQYFEIDEVACQQCGDLLLGFVFFLSIKESIPHLLATLNPCTRRDSWKYVFRGTVLRSKRI